MMLFPINTRFLVSLRYVDLGGLVSAASGLGVVYYAAHQLHITPSAMQMVGFGVLCAVAILIHYSLMFLMATMSFWIVRAQGMVMAYYNLFSIARIPDGAFSGATRMVFTLAIPMLVVSNVPVKLVLNKLGSPGEIALMLAMSVAFFLLSHLVWSRALRQYSSASS